MKKISLNRRILAATAAACFSGLSAQAGATAVSLNIADKPLFLVSVPPAVMVMLDNSGSMKAPLYGNNDNDYDNSKNYHGMFDASKSYIYNSSIPVNTTDYSVTVDTGAKGAFVESDCTPSASNATCWSGRFLNWLMTRRIDSSRVVLVGGKLESETAYNYGTDYAGKTLQYKLVGNNEVDDDNSGSVINKSHSTSSAYSPIPDGQKVSITSTPDASSGAIRTSYDPYAKFTAGGSSGVIYNSSGVAIGEFGTVTADHTETVINLVNTYTEPVAVAGPASFNGGDAGVVAVTDYSSSTIKLKFREWEYLDGSHYKESIPYVVVEKGHHVLPGGTVLRAGKKTTNKTSNVSGSCGGVSSNYETVSFYSSFSSKPVVIHGLMSDNDATYPVASRVWDIDKDGMRLTLQEEEDQPANGHGNETVGYIAVNAGTVVDATNEWSMEVGTKTNVDHGTSTITYSSSFGGVPSTLAAIQTMVGPDSSTLRADSVSASNIKLHVSEEGSCDTETNHADEDVGYMALYGKGTYNVALVVPNKPSGLLQKIDGKVRLGLSFYRYNHTSNNIYSGNSIDGGTLRFKLPKNPFVKKPSDSSLPAAERGFTELSGYVGTSITDISNLVQHYPLVWGTTPLAENLWEVIQYFEQDSPYYGVVSGGLSNFELADTNGDGVYEVPERDPFYYPPSSAALHCVAPSVIILTDGEPYGDSSIPADTLDYDGDSNGDDVRDLSKNDRTGKDNLDDVARWGFCDKDASGTCPDSDGDGTVSSDDEGNRDLRSDLVGDQSLRTYSVFFGGEAIANDVLKDTATNGGGKFYEAADGASLESVLTEAFTDAISASSASSVSVSTGSITTGTTLYYALFDGANWTGDIYAYGINADGSVASTATWKASTTLPAYGSRKIFTHDGTSGITFDWGSLSAAQKLLLNSDSTLLDYLRGDKSNENNSSGFRTRTKLLGDIVHSSPQLVGAPGAFRYPSNWNVSEPEGSVTYSSFATGAYSGRPSVVYAGGNDGMLHAFNAATGTELFAYVPNELFGKLDDLSDPDYSHTYYVDGAPTIKDAFYGGAWHTVLVGGYEAGGQGIYALDVTDPANFSASKVLWEFSDDDDADMGFSFSRPSIVRMHNGDWAAVFGNGFDNTEPDGTVSTSGHAVLYIVKISDGSLLAKIDTGAGSDTDPNGLATVSPVDENDDSIMDYIYAGDLYGNVWKFDVTSSNPASWGVAFSGSPLFTACNGSTCSSTNRQPITTRPIVGYHPKGFGSLVYFGTGKYFENTDNSAVNAVTQTLYGVWDKGSSHTAFTRDHLLSQSIVATATGSGGGSYRVVSDNSINWHSSSGSLPTGSPPTTHLGWYMDLYNTQGGNTDNYGERMVSDPVLRADKVIFTVMTPSSDACSAGGSSEDMVLSADDGGRLPYIVFDTNGDGIFDSSDYLAVDVDGDGTKEKVAPSGVTHGGGIVTTPGMLSSSTSNTDFMYGASSGGDLVVTRINAGPTENSRQSWRQLR